MATIILINVMTLALPYCLTHAHAHTRGRRDSDAFEGGAGDSPVHDVGGEGCGEAQHVEAELCGRTQCQAGHDGEQGEIYPQSFRGK